MERPTRAQLRQAIQYVSAELVDEAGPKHSLTEAGWLLAELQYVQEQVVQLCDSRYLASDELRDALKALVKGKP
jgi:hypothetical protein